MIEQRKQAFQLMIALTAESGSITRLSNKVSYNIIDNSAPSNFNIHINNILNESDAELVKVLKEAGMEKVEDVNIFGLLPNQILVILFYKFNGVAFKKKFHFLTQAYVLIQKKYFYEIVMFDKRMFNLASE